MDSNSTLILNKLILAIIFLCYSQTFLLGQSSGFTKTYFLDDRSTVFHAVRNQENKVIVLGQLGADALDHNEVFIARIDTLGEIEKLSIFGNPKGLSNLNLSYFGTEALASTDDKGYIFAGATRQNKNLFLIKVDSLLNLESYWEFEGKYNVRYVTFVIPFKDAYYSMGLAQDASLDYRLFIQKTDFSGKEIWDKMYEVSPYWGGSSSAILEDNGITVLAYKSYDPSHAMYNDESIWTQIFKIDSSGTVLKKFTTTTNEEGSAPEGLIKIEANYFYTSHPGYRPSSQTIHYAPEIVSRDSLFKLRWRKVYGDTIYNNSFSTLTKGPDGFLYAAGYVPNEDSEWGRVCKIDPENGELIWDTRDTSFYISGWGSRNRLEGLTALISGSIIAVGYTMDYTFHENGLLYKVSKDGCIDTLCAATNIEDLLLHPDQRIQFYPNPASELINIDIGDHPLLLVEIYDLQGVLMKKELLVKGQNRISLNNDTLVPGIYFWKISTIQNQIVDSGRFIIHH
jgi:hypothetical protein